MGRCDRPPGEDPATPDADSVVPSYIPGWDPTLAPFDQIGEVSVPAGGVWTRIVGFQCGHGRRAWHERFGLDVDDLRAWQLLKIRIMRGGSAVGAVTFDNLESLAGWLWRDMRPFPFHMVGNDWIEMQASNADNTTAYTLRGCLKGVTTAVGGTDVP